MDLAILASGLLKMFLIAFVIAISPGVQTMYVMIAAKKDPTCAIKMIVGSVGAHSLYTVFAAIGAVTMLSYLDSQTFLLIYRSLALIGILIMIVFCRSLVLSIVELRAELRADANSTGPPSRISTSLVQNPYLVGVTTCFFNPYYISIMLFVEFDLFVNRLFPALSGTNTILMIIVGVLLISLTILGGLLLWFAPFGYLIYQLHQNGGWIGRELLIYGSAITFVIIVLLILSTICKLVLGPYVQLPPHSHHYVSPYALSSGYLFHGIPGLDSLF